MRALRLIASLLCVAWVWGGLSDDAHAKRKRRKRRPALQAAQVGSLGASRLNSGYRSRPTTERRKLTLEEPEHQLAVAMVLQGDINYGPTAVGVVADYQLRLSERWGLNAGVGLGLRQHRTLIEPHIGAELTIFSLERFAFHAGFGFAAPVQLMADTAALAAAGRGELGVRWRALDWLRPHAGIAIVAGPLVTPGHLVGKTYIAVQMVVGSAFAL